MAQRLSVENTSVSEPVFFLCLNREVVANIVACSSGPLLATLPWEGLEGSKQIS